MCTFSLQSSKEEIHGTPHTALRKNSFTLVTQGSAASPSPWEAPRLKAHLKMLGSIELSRLQHVDHGQVKITYRSSHHRILGIPVLKH